VPKVHQRTPQGTHGDQASLSALALAGAQDTDMNEPCAISGALTGYKTMADGTLRLQIDLDESQSKRFHKFFPSVHCLVAILRLAETKQSDSQGDEHADSN
jgi:hypothetical protein